MTTLGNFGMFGIDDAGLTPLVQCPDGQAMTIHSLSVINETSQSKSPTVGGVRDGEDILLGQIPSGHSGGTYLHMIRLTDWRFLLVTRDTNNGNRVWGRLIEKFDYLTNTSATDNQKNSVNYGPMLDLGVMASIPYRRGGSSSPDGRFVLVMAGTSYFLYEFDHSQPISSPAAFLGLKETGEWGTAAATGIASVSPNAIYTCLDRAENSDFLTSEGYLITLSTGDDDGHLHTLTVAQSVVDGLVSGALTDHTATTSQDGLSPHTHAVTLTYNADTKQFSATVADNHSLAHSAPCYRLNTRSLFVLGWVNTNSAATGYVNAPYLCQISITDQGGVRFGPHNQIGTTADTASGPTIFAPQANNTANGAAMGMVNGESPSFAWVMQRGSNGYQSQVGHATFNQDGTLKSMVWGAATTIYSTSYTAYPVGVMACYRDNASGIPNYVGVWANGTPAVAGKVYSDSLIGGTNTSLWRCETSHTSSGADFSAARTANPTYWTNVSDQGDVPGVHRAMALATTSYSSVAREYYWVARADYLTNPTTPSVSYGTVSNQGSSSYSGMDSHTMIRWADNKFFFAWQYGNYPSFSAVSAAPTTTQLALSIQTGLTRWTSLSGVIGQSSSQAYFYQTVCAFAHYGPYGLPTTDGQKWLAYGAHGGYHPVLAQNAYNHTGGVSNAVSYSPPTKLFYNDNTKSTTNWVLTWPCYNSTSYYNTSVITLPVSDTCTIFIQSNLYSVFQCSYVGLLEKYNGKYHVVHYQCTGWFCNAMTASAYSDSDTVGITFGGGGYSTNYYPFFGGVYVNKSSLPLPTSLYYGANQTTNNSLDGACQGHVLTSDKRVFTISSYYTTSSNAYWACTSANRSWSGRDAYGNFAVPSYSVRWALTNPGESDRFLILMSDTSTNRLYVTSGSFDGTPGAISFSFDGYDPNKIAPWRSGFLQNSVVCPETVTFAYGGSYLQAFYDYAFMGEVNASAFLPSGWSLTGAINATETDIIYLGCFHSSSRKMGIASFSYDRDLRSFSFLGLSQGEAIPASLAGITSLSAGASYQSIGGQTNGRGVLNDLPVPVNIGSYSRSMIPTQTPNYSRNPCVSLCVVKDGAEIPLYPRTILSPGEAIVTEGRDAINLSSGDVLSLRTDSAGALAIFGSTLSQEV